ncbi:MAG: MBL fold metallo-hydrolase [Cytophagales bacterium]|nr:MBL fold metallo-hydrolase [Cytophagales bacterium]
MKLHFYGAARQVTGSLYLLTTDSGYNILIDCGQQMSRPKPNDTTQTTSPEYKPLFPFEPKHIHLVLLTHAHLDHSGRLPLLVREGYEGQILCTQPTFHLTHILLHDAAQLFQRRIKRILDKNRNKTKAPENLEEYYFVKNVEQTLERFVTIATHQKFKINDEIAVYFNHAGHLLGAANIIITIKENNTEKKICFSGDIGRKNYMLLNNPMPIPQVQYLVCECTYGNRLHTPNLNPADILFQIIKKSCIDKPGKLIIPAFSVGRTQALLYTLNTLYRDKKIPHIKVYSDSPMAKESSLVYEKYVKQLNKEAREFFDDEDCLFDFDNYEYVHDVKKSKALTLHSEPCIIVSSSGMISGGRVEHHINQSLQNPMATILFIGYCAEGTIGHELVNGAKTIKIKEKNLEVRAQIVVIDCFSAHADQHGLTEFVLSQDATLLQNIFLTHGEGKAFEVFQNHLHDKGFHKVTIPEMGQIFEL